MNQSFHPLLTSYFVGVTTILLFPCPFLRRYFFSSFFSFTLYIHTSSRLEFTFWSSIRQFGSMSSATVTSGLLMTMQSVWHARNPSFVGCSSSYGIVRNELKLGTLIRLVKRPTSCQQSIEQRLSKFTAIWNDCTRDVSITSGKKNFMLVNHVQTTL